MKQARCMAHRNQRLRVISVGRFSCLMSTQEVPPVRMQQIPINGHAKTCMNPRICLADDQFLTLLERKQKPWEGRETLPPFCQQQFALSRIQPCDRCIYESLCTTSHHRQILLCTLENSLANRPGIFR